MIMKIEYQDRIEDYLLNRMSNDERTVFEQDLKKDAALRDQYEFISMLKTALMIENIEKDVLSIDSDGEDIAAVATSENEESDCNYDNIIKLDLRKKQSLSRFSKSHVIVWISGLAAVFIVGLFIFNQLIVDNNTNSSEIAYIQAPDTIFSSIIKDEDMSFDTGRKMDMKCMSTRGNALAQIEEYEVYINSELMRLERELNSRGEEDFGEEIDSLKRKLLQLQYYKAKALIKLNRIKEAIKLLDEIRHSKSKYKEQADSLYKHIKK